MNYQDRMKKILYPAFAMVLGVGLLALSDEVVKSERKSDARPLPNKFKRFPERKNDSRERIAAPAGPTSPGGLESKWTIDFSSDENAVAVALQADGKTVAAGWTSVVGSTGAVDYDIAIFRYNPDGTVDTSFDADGKVTTPISNEFNNWDAAYTLAIQADGRIVVGGASGGIGSNRSALVRYMPDGSLDNSFGSGGKVINESAFGGINDIALQTDGKIVATGYNSGIFTIFRYNANGSVDATFGTGGMVTTNFGSQYQSSYSVAIQPDGKIVAAGDTGFCDKDENCFFDFALSRYNTDGSPDNSFDGDGKVTTTFGQDYEYAASVIVQPDGKVVVAGEVNVLGFGVARYNSDGSLDTSFDVDGKVTTSVSPVDHVVGGLALQSDSKIVVSGGAYLGATGYDFALVRWNSDGSLDSSFDGDGKVSTDFGRHEVANDIDIRADGRIIVAGYKDGEGTNDFALARYNTNGSLDASFDGDGKLTTTFRTVPSTINGIVSEYYFVGYANNGANDDFAIATINSVKRIIPIGNSHDRAYAGTIGPSGTRYTVGYSDNGSNTDFAVLENYGGFSGFGQNGKVLTDFGGSNDEARAVAVLPDYRIVVAGHTDVNGVTALALARYNINGSLDPSFGSGGKVVIQAVRNARALAIQPDGKIVAAGNAPHTESPFGTNFAIARLNTDGSLDASFDVDGIAVTRFDFSSQVNSVALQPYGKIVAAGVTRNNGDTVSQFAVARYNSDGSLDTSFDADGKVTTSFAQRSEANAVGVQRNGKIVAAGVSFNGITGRDFALSRYNSNGSLDTTFDTDGKRTTDFFGDNDDAAAAAVQRDGLILVAGGAYQDGKNDFAIAQYSGDAVPAKVSFDFDGDGLADAGVFRPANGVWYLNRSTEGFSATAWGTSSDKITPADFDGDGKTDIAVFRDGTWYLRASRFFIPEAIPFGLPGDIPVPGDYDDADGRAELTIYRGGLWWSLNLRNNFVSVVEFGLPGDKPVPADYDGDGRTDRAVYRNGEWHINGSSRGYTVERFGLETDLPVPADYDGDSKADLAVYRGGTWYLQQSTAGFTALNWGLATDTPAPADYDGDGKTDQAVYRNGLWYLLQSSGGASIQQFGLANDRPLAAAYLP